MTRSNAIKAVKRWCQNCKQTGYKDRALAEEKLMRDKLAGKGEKTLIPCPVANGWWHVRKA